MENSVLLILTGKDSASTEEAAFGYAQSVSKELVVLQILTSDLYHYGHHDVIATRPSKRQFLLYVRDEVLACAKEKATALEDRAKGLGIGVEFLAVESEDVASAAAKEAEKGYDAIFVSREKRSFFPLLERSLGQYLKKRKVGKIVEC